MHVGLRRLNRSLFHAKISDYYYAIENMEIDGERDNVKDNYFINKCNPPWNGAISFLSKRKILVNRKDWNTHGYFEDCPRDDYEDDY